jgi:hypothetical protein
MTASSSSTDPEPRESASWRTGLLLLAVLCSVGAVVAIWQIHPVEHGKIKAVCETLAGAIERRDTKAAEGLLSATYRDGRGLDRTGALQKLFVYLDAHSVVHITPLSITVSHVGKDQAHATAKVWLAQATPPPRGARDAVQLDLSLRREDGKWRVTSAEDWELPAGDFEQPDDDSDQPNGE